MSFASSCRLRIPSHYYVYSDPPDKDGEEILHFISTQRRVKMKGRSFREFTQRVVPLLDGTRSFDEIHAEVSDIFDADDLAESLTLLDAQGVLEDTSDTPIPPPPDEERLRPQLNLFHDLSLDPRDVQRRLAESRVTVIGLTPVGIAASRALAAAGIGHLRGIDPDTVGPADVFFSPELRPEDCGTLRAEALHLPCAYELLTERLADDELVERTIAGSSFVVNALDEGNLSLMYRLNRVCLKSKTPWITASASGLEITVGPTVYPGETACYMCYRMRIVACAANPETAFNHESYLDRRKTDDSARRANFAFGPAIAGHLAAAEVMKALCGFAWPATRGRLQVLDLRELSSTLHVVLRKPWCPACDPMASPAAAGSAS